VKTLWDLLGVGKGREARRADRPQDPGAPAPPLVEPKPQSERPPRREALPLAPGEAQRSPGSGAAVVEESPGRGEGRSEARTDRSSAHSTPASRNGKSKGKESRLGKLIYSSMADRYEALTRQMLREHDVRVRKWRSGMSGCAWEVHYASGRVSRLIEAPKPKGPMSCAIFLHEIGHHAIGFGRYRPRCLEEYHAWRFAIEQMELHGVKVTDGVRKRMDDSMRYAVDKARRRGLRQLPAELARWDGKAPPRE
jgi:hypothetical protein